MSIKHVLSNVVPDATGTLTVWAGSTTATAPATDMVQPKDWNSLHNITLALAGNTLGASSLSGTDIVWAGGSNISLSGIQGANIATVSLVGASGVGTGTTFAGTNISASMSLDSAGLGLSLSGGAGGGGGPAISAAGSSVSAGTVVFSNSNNISFGMNGSTVTATANARASTDAVGLNTAQTNVTWTVNSAGISLNAAGYAGTGTTFNGANISGSITQNSNGIALSLSGLAALTSQSNQALSAANGSFAFQTASFSNVNGVSFATAAGSAIQANFAGPTLALTNLSGTTSSNTAGHTLSLSAAAPGAASLNVSAGTTSNNVTQLVFSNSNGVSFGLDGSTVTASADAGGGGGSASATQFFPAFGNLSQSNFAIGFNGLLSAAYFYPFNLVSNVTGSVINLNALITNSSTASNSGQVGATYYIGIYTQNASDSTRIQSHYTTTYTIAASNSSNVSRAFSWISGLANSTSYDTASSSSAGLNLSSLFHGNRELQVAFVSTLTPGRYWFAVSVSTSGAGTTNGVLSMNLVCWRLGLNNDNFVLGGATNNATISGLLQSFGIGSYTNGGAGLPDSVGFSDLYRENNNFPVAIFKNGQF